MSHQVRDFFPKEMFSLAFQDKRIWQACKNQKRSEGIGASQVLSLCCKLGWKKKGAPDLCLSNQGNLLFPCTIGIPCSATGNHHPHSGPHSHYKDTFHNICSNNIKRQATESIITSKVSYFCSDLTSCIVCQSWKQFLKGSYCSNEQ